MNLDDVFYGAVLGKDYIFDNFVYYRQEQSQPCLICGKSTQWVCLNMELSVCSTECSDIERAKFFADFDWTVWGYYTTRDWYKS